jgi:flagellin
MSRINHNITSLQAMNRLIANQTDLGTRLERLSSGLRINRGKDDPAGLIASENLRAEIHGINAAIENSTRANNVISTAEGALNEVSALLLEVRGLVTSTANTGGLASEERKANQLQVDSILQSIDRISNTTQFNGKKLLDGSLEYTLSNAPAASQISEVRLYSVRTPDKTGLPVTVQVTTSAQAALVLFSGAQVAAPTAIRVTGSRGSEVLAFASSTHTSAIAATINSFRDVLGVSAIMSGTDGLKMYSTDFGLRSFVKVESIGTYNFRTKTAIAGPLSLTTTDFGVDAKIKVNGQDAAVDGLMATIKNSSIDAEILMTPKWGAGIGGAIGTVTFGVKSGGATFQLSPTVNRLGQVSLGILSVSTGTLGNHDTGYLSSLGTGQVNSLVTTDGVQAQRIVDRAITQVSVQRGRLGAFQKNTIETNVNSMQVALENVTASESAIRDTDFAQETAQMTRAQILVQATTSILKMANTTPQNALALLQ